MNLPCFSPRGDLLVTGSMDQTARVWDTQTAGSVTVLGGHTGGVRGVAFSPERQAAGHHEHRRNRARLGALERPPDPRAARSRRTRQARVLRRRRAARHDVPDRAQGARMGGRPGARRRPDSDHDRGRAGPVEERRDERRRAVAGGHTRQRDRSERPEPRPGAGSPRSAHRHPPCRLQPGRPRPRDLRAGLRAGLGPAHGTSAGGAGETASPCSARPSPPTRRAGSCSTSQTTAAPGCGSGASAAGRSPRASRASPGLCDAPPGGSLGPLRLERRPARLHRRSRRGQPYDCAICGGADELVALAKERLRGPARARRATPAAKFSPERSPDAVRTERPSRARGRGRSLTFPCASAALTSTR